MGPIVAVHHLSVNRQNRYVLQDIQWSMQPSEQWALLGPTGSGKTLFTLCLTGEMPCSGRISTPDRRKTLRVQQQHHFRNRSNTTDLYYQQRFHAHDAADALTVREWLEQDRPKGSENMHALLDTMQLTHTLDKSLLLLSNGEHKRLQLAKAILQCPELLILDNPFTGLDVEGRALLNTLLEQLVARGTHLLLVTGPEDIPPCITHVACLVQGRMMFAGTKEQFLTSNYLERISENTPLAIPANLSPPREEPFTHAVVMREVSVVYGSNRILDKVSWQVERGTRWLLRGPNGAGKSTLLSLIYADNPQAYANEIYIFDRRRGSGESIWDIKKSIGYVSPELHAYFGEAHSVFEVVASGFFDTIGLFRTLSDAQQGLVLQWLNSLGLHPHFSQPFRNLSLGQQRLAMLARALIKHPPLLILDEPCQGLDQGWTISFNRLIDTICRQQQTTLIYVSHYADAVPSCITHELVMEGGRVKSVE